MIRNEGDTLKQVIVCTPRTEYYRAAELNRHNLTVPADPGTAMRQHQLLTELLSREGAEVIDLPELPGHPNSVFTRDTAVITPEGYIQLRMGLPTRRGEEQWMAANLEKRDFPQLEAIKSPATAEGGDIILAGKVVFIGRSSRTNDAGIDQLRPVFKRMGFEVRATDVPSPYLHIGGAMSMIAPDTVLSCRGVFPHQFFKGFRNIRVTPGDFISGNVICPGNNRVIAHAGNENVINRLAQHGIDVQTLDLCEFVKGTGGPSCLILPVNRG